MLYSFAHAFVDAARMENAGRQFLFVKGRGKAKHIGIKNQLGADARAERIAVDADNTGERSAIGIKSGWRIVRLYFKNQICIVIEFDDAGVIHKNRETEILLAFGLADFGRRSFDIFFEKRIYF